MPKLKILFVAHSANWGGAENCLYSLLADLDREKFEPLVVLPSAGPLSQRIQELGVRTTVADLQWCLASNADDWEHRIGWASGLKRRATMLAELITREQVQLVFSNSLAVIDGAIAAALCGVPHVFQVLELLADDPGLHPPLNVAAFHQLVTALSDRIITVSSSVKTRIEADCGAGKVITIHTGLALPAEFQNGNHRSLEDQRPSVCFVGSLSKRKGVLRLIEAAAKVLSAVPGAQFIVVGPDGGVAEEAERALVEQGLSENFRMLGFREDTLAIIANSTLLVLPSLSDPLPLVVLEAMHLGKPVVATLSGGASEMVVDGLTGLLVPVNDSTALAAAIVQILEDLALAALMGEAARARAHTHFNRKKQTELVENLLVEVHAQGDATASRRLLVEVLLATFESFAVEGLLDDARKAREFELLVPRIQTNPLFKAYHWIKHSGN